MNNIQKEINKVCDSNTSKEVYKVFEKCSLSLITWVIDNYWNEKCAAKNNKQIFDNFALEYAANVHLIEAIDCIKKTKIPAIFENTDPEQLVKYIAQQAQGILANGETYKGEEAYKSTCAIFTKKLTDLSILTYPK